MAHYLGIDFGDSYIGLAFAEEGSIAVPLKVVRYDASFWDVVNDSIKEHGVTHVIVGWPVSLSGSQNERTDATDRFIAHLEHKVRIPVIRVDERLSSAAAKHRGVLGRVDAVAAAEILQTYLDRHESAGRPV